MTQPRRTTNAFGKARSLRTWGHVGNCIVGKRERSNILMMRTELTFVSVSYTFSNPIRFRTHAFLKVTFILNMNIIYTFNMP